MSKERSKSILVVNSEPGMADLFAEMLLLDAHDYITTTTFSGKGCLSAVNKNRYDMILMDIDLPDMEGWDLIEKIKNKKPDLAVVVITSRIPLLSDMDLLNRVSDYLIKPVTLDCLQMAVRDAIEIPYLLDQCVDTIKTCKENADSTRLLYLLKQSILDRKRFILMRQLYPDRKLENDPETRRFLDDLNKKINIAQNEIRRFKNKSLLVA